jgi:potassium-dependent mechanosensitive channel
MTTRLVRCLTALALAACLLASLAAGAWAQDDITEDLERWDTLAARAEALADDDSAADETLQALRARIADFRSEFNDARSINGPRIQALREQIAALGPAPEGEGAEPEAPEVAANRAELNDQLNTLLAPVQRAEAAYARADGLIREIDGTLRERQTRKLLTISPSPLNPVNWGPALADLRASAVSLWAETKAAAASRSSGQLRESLPLAIGLGALGLLLIFRGRNWAGLIVGRLRTRGTRGLGIWRFVVSLFRVILPLLGLVALVSGVIASGAVGPDGTEILSLLPVIGGMVLGFRWVSERVFSRDDDEALILLAPEDRKRARACVSVITVMIVIQVILLQMVELGESGAATQPVLAFPFFVVISVALFRLGSLLRGYAEPADAATPEETRISTLSRIERSLGRGAMIVACVAPLIAAAGYYEAADALQGPYVLSLALLGLVMALQRFTADVYGAVTGQGVEARDALMPVLFGMILLLLAAPLFALIWGARLTDLTELWASFSRGFTVGDSRISPTDFLAFVVIFAIGYVLTRLIQGTLRSSVLPKTRLDIGGQNAIVSGLGYVGIFLAAILAITGAGINLSALAYVAGALSVGIGFGLQNVVSNFVSGIILLIERPISEGDWIEVGGQMGYVRDISVRSTRIETFDKTDVIVPNADLISGTVTNYTRGNTVGRLIVPVGVAYGSDTRRVEAILREIAEAQPMVLATPPVNIFFLNFGADALEFEIRCMLRDVNWIMKVKNDINHQIAARFGEEGIEIPFAQRDLWLRNPEALASRPSPGGDQSVPAVPDPA